MKKIVFGEIFFLLLSFCMPIDSFAEEPPSTWQTNDWAKILAGVATGAINHEAGHQIMAAIYDDHLVWMWDSSDCLVHWGYPKETKNIRNIALGGFLSETLSSEIILNSDFKNSQFLKGWLLWNIGSGLIYAALDLFAGQQGFGDWRDIRNNESGLKTEWLMAGKIAHSIWTAYRFWNKKGNNLPPKINYFLVPTPEYLLVGVNYQF